MKNKLVFLILPLLFFLAAILIFVSNKTPAFSSNASTQNKFIYIDAADHFNHILYRFEVNSKGKNVLFKKAVEGYPTSAYSKSKEIVYFTKKVDDDSTQLFQKNLKNNTIKQLTKNLNFVDFLELDETKQIIYMRVLVGQNSRNFHIATYNLRTSKYTVWNSKDNDTSVVAFDYNPKIKELLVVTKSIREEFNNINESNKNHTAPIPPLNKLAIFTNDGRLERQILALKKFVRSASLSNDGKKVLINYKDGIEPDKPSKIANYKIDGGGGIELLLQDSKQNFNIRQPKYDQGNSGFYFIADDGPIGSSSFVKYFDLKSKKVKQLFHNDHNLIINIYY
jgi:hypothetical protein